MSGELADPYVASREMPPHEPHRRAGQADRSDRSDRSDRQRFLNRPASGAWTRWPG